MDTGGDSSETSKGPEGGMIQEPGVAKRPDKNPSALDGVESSETGGDSSETPEGPSGEQATESEVSKGPEVVKGPEATKKSPREAMRPALDGLTESLTLKILSQLDLRSLGRVQQVCRRLNRVAQDENLFSRVTHVQWQTAADYRVDLGHFRTNCAHLGVVAMPAREIEAAEAAGKFISALERLLEGGAAPVSLETPLNEFVEGDALTRLPALLGSFGVELRSLACSHSEELADVLPVQPSLEHLSLPCLPLYTRLGVEFDGATPNLRHMDLYMPDGFHEEEDLECLNGRLRSLVVLFEPTGWGSLEKLLNVIQGGEDKLLFRASSDISISYGRWDMEEPWRMAFAVEDFQPEERGRAFLRDGQPWDAWDEAEHRIPQPTREFRQIYDFLDQLGKDLKGIVHEEDFDDD